MQSSEKDAGTFLKILINCSICQYLDMPKLLLKFRIARDILSEEKNLNDSSDSFIANIFIKFESSITPSQSNI